MSDVVQVLGNINKIYSRRKAQVYALALFYAAKALRSFQIKQRNGAFWKNKTGSARDEMFSDGFVEGDVVGWFMAHGVEYGPYLELGNDGRNEAIRPTLMIYAPQFIKAVKELYSDAA